MNNAILLSYPGERDNQNEKFGDKSYGKNEPEKNIFKIPRTFFQVVDKICFLFLVSLLLKQS